MRAVLLSGLLVFGGPPLALMAQPAPSGSDAARAVLLAQEKQWNDAIVTKDIAVLERILAPSFVFIDVDGTQSTRAELLENIRSPKLIIDPFVTHDVQVRVYGGTAVVTGWIEQTGRYDGRRFTIRQRYTDVYVLYGPRWVAVSAHASPLRRMRSVQPN
jgi:ketosteroid isomerase-like protein